MEWMSSSKRSSGRALESRSRSWYETEKRREGCMVLIVYLEPQFAFKMDLGLDLFALCYGHTFT